MIKRLTGRSARTWAVLLLLAVAQTAAADPPQAPGAMAPMTGVPTTLAEWAHGAQHFDGLGAYHRKISTRSHEAQRYFDQGMRFTWAFNHDEATRSFARAAELDPACAMCLWGVAFTVGPNYNLPELAPARALLAHRTVAAAQARTTHGATPVEAALISALASRYPTPAALDPSSVEPVLKAFAAQMSRVAAQFPADDDIQVLYAESLMNINAWKLWTPAGDPAEGTPEIVALLEKVLARNPQHPGANHYYVHALEASPHPERAVAAAERLRGMMPAAGHLEHMPSHIMQRVGRYADSAEANRLGAAADRAYLARTQPPDYYAMYVAHNFDFLAFATSMQGRRAETLSAVAAARAMRSDELLTAMPSVEWYSSAYYLARVRFADWDGLLAEPRPPASQRMLTGAYLFANAVALAKRGRTAESQQRIEELDMLRAGVAPDAIAGLSRATQVLDVAVAAARGELALARGERVAGLAELEQAVAAEDGLAYNEPADWFFPVRHLLGAAQLEAGLAADAEATFRADLARHPANGWALRGLAAALRAEHRDADAALVEQQFKAAWKDADVAPESSAL